MIVAHITYDRIQGSYDKRYFLLPEKRSQGIDRASASKDTSGLCFTDGIAERASSAVPQDLKPQ
jgi:hypothetical protein